MYSNIVQLEVDELVRFPCIGPQYFRCKIRLFHGTIEELVYVMITNVTLIWNW